MSRAIGATLAGPALLMLLGAMAFSGQPGDTDEKAKDKKDPEPRKQATKLVILVEAKAEQTKEDVLKTLLKGAALAKWIASTTRSSGRPTRWSGSTSPSIPRFAPPSVNSAAMGESTDCATA